MIRNSLVPLFLMLVCAPVGAHAAEPGRLVVLPLKSDGLAKEVASGYEQHLRTIAAKKSSLVDRKSAKKAGAKATCKKAACWKKVATSAKARFVLSASVNSADEIYNVDLWLYDAANDRSSKGSGICELCAADEVNGTIESAFAELDAALKAPAPKPKPKPKPDPPAGKKPVLEVVTTPPGASVLLDGTDIGVTPVKVEVEIGKHIIVVAKEGFVVEERTITAMGKNTKAKPLKLDIALKGEEPVPPPPPTDPPAVPPPVDPGAGGYSRLGWGFTIGGTVLVGAGAFLIHLDGTVTCDDGRGRTECPNVYDTRGMGATALGLGAALVGSGITLLIVDPGEGKSADGDPADVEQPASEASIAPTLGGAVLNWRTRF